MRHADPLVNHIVNRGQPRPTHTLCPRHHEMQAVRFLTRSLSSGRPRAIAADLSLILSSLAAPGTTDEEHDENANLAK